MSDFDAKSSVLRFAVEQKSVLSFQEYSQMANA
jgi:hypothetical protein